MDITEALDAWENGTKVEAGVGEDHDTGRIISIANDGTKWSVAMVAWDSGVRTPCPICDLSAA